MKGIDPTVQRGELFGLLGPNGAGKSGRVSIAGIDVVEHPAEARR